MKKEILRSRDILSRKIQRLLSCHFSPRTLGGSCQEKEDPGKSGIKCEHINGRNDRFLRSCMFAPWRSQKIFAQTQGFDYWQLIR